MVDTRTGILEDGADGQAFWERDADRRVPMASTTKIMTALIAVERLPLNTPVRVRQGADRFPGESVAGLRAGDELPLGEMLYALLLPSGNEAAVAIGQTVAGSTEAFVALMNQRASEMGLKDTHFTNPQGLDAPDHYTTARELAKIARAALALPAIAEVVSTKEHVVGRYHWKSTNDLLFRRPDATGVKTGTTEGAGQALVASARRNDRRALAVVLNAPGDRFDVAGRLLDFFFLQHTSLSLSVPISPFYRGLAVAQVRTITVPLWQASLFSTRVLPTDDGATLDLELAGKPLGQERLR